MLDSLDPRGGCPMPPIPDGFDAGDLPLPDRPTDSPPERRRWHAAMLVHAIACGATPEDLAAGVSPRRAADFLDPLNRAEALAHVDLLLGALMAPEGAL